MKCLSQMLRHFGKTTLSESVSNVRDVRRGGEGWRVCCFCHQILCIVQHWVFCGREDSSSTSSWNTILAQCLSSHNT